MSLAMFAAPFHDNTDLLTNTPDNIMNQKRQAQKAYNKNNRTQKIYGQVYGQQVYGQQVFGKENFDTNKVNDVLKKIHSNLDSGGDSDEEDDNMVYGQGKQGSQFDPPPPAQSAGVEKTKMTSSPTKTTESMINMTASNDPMFRTIGGQPQPNYEGGSNLDLNDYGNYGDTKTAEEYYKRVLPGYVQQTQQYGPHPKPRNHANRPYYNQSISDSGTGGGTSQDILLQKLNYMITLLEDQQDERTNNVTEEVVLYSFLGIFIIFIADTFVRAGKYVR
jgi:hypothetical protein